MSKEALSVVDTLKLALEALETLTEGHSLGGKKLGDKAITAIKEALAQPEQEPYGYLKLNTGKFVNEVEGLNPMKDKRYLPLYTTPYVATPLPQRDSSATPRTWVDLTDEEIRKLCVTTYGGREFCRLVEAKLREKNT